MKKQLPEELRKGHSDIKADLASESEKKSMLGRAKDFISRKKNDSSTDAASSSEKPGWVAPAADRERFSRETQADLENSAATARSRREKIEARIQELKSETESLSSEEKKQAALKKIAKKESDASKLAEKEKNIRDRIDQANEPIKITQPGDKIIEIQRDSWDNMTAREKKEAAYRSFEKGSEERKIGKESYMANLTAKEQREHKENSSERKALTAGKIGVVGTIGTLGVGALISAGVATAKAVTDDKELTGGQAQVQIFEGGAQPTSSSVESSTFQPTGGNATGGDATGGSFTAVSPID